MLVSDRVHRFASKIHILYMPKVAVVHSQIGSEGAGFFSVIVFFLLCFYVLCVCLSFLSVF